MILSALSVLAGCVIAFLAFALTFNQGLDGLMIVAAGAFAIMLPAAILFRRERWLAAGCASFPGIVAWAGTWIAADLQISKENGVLTMLMLAGACATALFAAAWASPWMNEKLR